MILHAQFQALGIHTCCNHMVNWGSFHMDSIIIKGILDLMHHSLISGNLPLGLDLREHDSTDQQCAGFHSKPVAGAVVIAVMPHQEICMIT